LNDLRSPDPVSEAAAYQRLLLGELGDDDPADVQAATPGHLRRLVAEAGDHLRAAPSPGEWSVLECIGHILDAEMVGTVRYRWILSEDRPDIVGYDQALWAEHQRHAEADPELMLSTLEALRAANLDLWRRSTADQRARIGLHRERGEESYELTFRLIAGHDRLHTAQARRALAQVRE
jgi:DinB superfamily